MAYWNVSGPVPVSDLGSLPRTLVALGVPEASAKTLAEWLLDDPRKNRDNIRDYLNRLREGGELTKRGRRWRRNFLQEMFPEQGAEEPQRTRDIQRSVQNEARRGAEGGEEARRRRRQRDGGGGGGGRQAGEAPIVTPTFTDQELERKVRQEYPEFAWLLDEPEVRDLLFDAVREPGISAIQFRSRLMETKWWNTTSETARIWDTLTNTDPAEAERQQRQTALTIRNQSRAMGADVDFSESMRLAERSLRLGWSPEQTNRALVRRVDFSGRRPPEGAAGGAYIDVDRIATQDYLLRLDDKTLDKLTKQVLRGQIDDQGLKAFMSERALSRYPSLDRDLKNGLTPGEVLGDVRLEAARLLEVDADAVDLTRRKFRPILDHVDANGNRRPMTVSEASEYVRGLDDFIDNPDNMTAKNEMADVLAQVSEQFGVLAR